MSTIQSWLILLVAGITIYVLARELKVWQSLRERGQKTTARVDRLYVDNQQDGTTYVVVYSFAPKADGGIKAEARIIGKGGVSQKLFKRLRLGAGVRVRYDASNPAINRIEDSDTLLWGFHSRL